MPITIGSNIASLMAQRKLTQASSKLESVYERLSSGMRINQASDDAAGLSIADSLKANVRIYTQAIRNANDGLSVISIADGGLQELNTIVTRIAELAQQSANGVYSSVQRQALDAEAQALASEYSRITASVNFNGVSLLSGAQDQISVQVGLDSSANSQISIRLPSVAGSSTWDGTFTLTDMASQGGRTQVVATGDFNGDGNLDVVGTGMSGSNLEYAYGNGDGTFQNTVVLNPNNNATIGTGDFNGDGRTDIISNRSGISELYLGTGAGFSYGGVIGGVTSPASPPLVADLNGDGALDYGLVDTSSDSYQIILGNGNGTFQAAQNVNLGVDVLDADYGDLNNDGNLDIYFRVTGNEVVAFGNGDGTFQPGTAISQMLSEEIELGDVNNDGNLDMVTAYANGGGVGVYLGNGDGTFGAQTTVLTQNLFGDITLYDINQDGNLDIFRTDRNNLAMQVYLGNGDSTFAAAISFNTGASSRMRITLGDFNNDGVADAVIPGYDNHNIFVMSAGATESASLSNISLLTQDASLETLTRMKTIAQSLSAARATLGADQSRLQSALNNIYSQRENSIAAESRIRDMDVADGVAELTKQQIIQKISSAILAQANQQPSIALKLL